MKQAVESFIEKSLDKNKRFQRVFTQQLEDLKGGQSPGCYVLMCGDSRCTKQAFMGDDYTLGEVFGGPATMGNIVSEHILATLSFNVDHLKTPIFVVCGHTGCGAIDASMGDFSAERDVLKMVLGNLKEAYEGVDVHPKVTHLDLPTQNVFKNVQAQVLKVVANFELEVQKGDFTVLGAVYDNQGVLGDLGQLYFTSINGNVCFKF